MKTKAVKEVKEVALSGGFTATDNRLGRLAEFDERSRAYPIRMLTGIKPLRSYTWRCESWLDQLREGSCVGHAWTHELAGRPVAIKDVTHDLAVKIYKGAQVIDEWPGTNYSGTSVLAGAKIVQGWGFITEYRWAFGLNDLVLALGYAGPAVLGINWYEGMFNADDQGVIRVGGDVAGGHAILAHGIKMVWKNPLSPKLLANADLEKSRIRLRNSWGRAWGIDGGCEISLADMSRLLHEQGEACIAVGRKWKLAA